VKGAQAHPVIAIKHSHPRITPKVRLKYTTTTPPSPVSTRWKSKPDLGHLKPLGRKPYAEKHQEGTVIKIADES